MRVKKIFFLLLSFLVLVLGLEAQNIQKMIKKADKTYHLGSYAQAIPLYKELLLLKDNTAHRTKLADCYRLTNQIEDASEIYESILLTAKRIRPKVYLHYGEILLNQGKYEKAEEMLEKYLVEKPEDGNALQLKDNISEISYIQPYYKDVEVTPFSYNSSADDHGAVFLDDGIVFVSDRPRGVVLFKEKTGTTGRDFLSLYFAPRTDRLEYGEPSILPNRINELNKNTGPASFTKDGKTMVFSRNSYEESNRGELTLQLFMAKRENGKWKKGKKIPFCNINFNYMHPAISPDGNTLFFVSNKSGKKRGTDIYKSELKDGKWSKPTNLGEAVNTSANEGFPYFHEDGKLFFCSKGYPGYGGFDIFFTEQLDDGSWMRPVNLGAPINSSADDISFCLNNTGDYGLFTSSRDKGDDDIFLFRYKKDDKVFAGKIDTGNVEDLAGASVMVVPSDGSDITKVEIASNHFELVLDNKKDYEITIQKEGFKPFTTEVISNDLKEAFVRFEASLERKE